MPRNYKLNSQSKKYGSCDKETLERALDMVAAGKSQRNPATEILSASISMIHSFYVNPMCRARPYLEKCFGEFWPKFSDLLLFGGGEFDIFHA